MTDKSAINILAVDDDPFILKAHCRILSNLGYTEVTCCEGAVRALEAIDDATSLPDLILLDLNMPVMDGVEFMRHLVKRDYCGSLILLSGEDERILQAAVRLVRAHEITVLGHLRKPIEQEALGRLIGKWKPTVTEPWSPLDLSKTAKLRVAYPAAAVRAAINNGELINYYQPIVSVESGHVVGVETLVRWQHPLHGLVFPDQFIPIAEENGMVRDLTRVVIDGALAQASTWKIENGLALHMAINLSMDDLASLDFVDYVANQAATRGVEPQDLTLEVTESRLMQDQRIPLEVLTRLSMKRFRISIDDFGTGHSSLAQLRDMPFDELKIDRGFVHGAWADETVRAIFDTSVILAKELGMNIVAEGVEDRADWDFVRRSKCDVAQGYFIAKPMPAENMREWIEDWEERAQHVS